MPGPWENPQALAVFLFATYWLRLDCCSLLPWDPWPRDRGRVWELSGQGLLHPIRLTCVCSFLFLSPFLWQWRKETPEDKKVPVGRPRVRTRVTFASQASSARLRWNDGQGLYFGIPLWALPPPPFSDHGKAAGVPWWALGWGDSLKMVCQRFPSLDRCAFSLSLILYLEQSWPESFSQCCGGFGISSPAAVRTCVFTPG